MFRKKKSIFSFVGTFKEFLEILKAKGFWETEEEYEQFLSDSVMQQSLTLFSEYNADLKNGLIFHRAVGYPPNTRPTYPNKVVLELATEGYTQEEVNKAFEKVLKELEKSRSKKEPGQIKDFILRKLDVITH